MDFALALIEKKLLQTRHNAVYDYRFQQTLAAAPWQEWLSKAGYFEVADVYKTEFSAWLNSGELNSVVGLERFEFCDLINGTTQGFDEAYYRYAGRRLRVLRGEYAYHRRVVSDAVFYEDQPLDANDYMIISWPFCGDGYNVCAINVILDQCAKLGVPVIIDGAWYGTCGGVHIDLRHPAITEAVFSLTKSTGTGNIRSGVRYSNYNDNLPIRQQNNYNHLVLGAAQIGLWMMRHFNPDWQYTHYRQWQTQLCDSLGVKPSLCVHIAIADGSEDWHQQFRIDDKHCKIGIRDALKAMRKGELTCPTK